MKLSGKDAVFIDLDGTIINSYEGIYNGFNYSFKKMNIDMPNIDIKQFIGPPIEYTMSKLFSKAQIKDIIAIYREYYVKKGLFECHLYEGMEETLHTLKDRGYMLYIATSKPQKMAETVLKHLKIDKYFIDIYGALDDSKDGAKERVLRYALKKSGEDKTKSLMIGDSEWDYKGAKANNIDFGAVLYGFGSNESIMHDDNFFTVDKSIEILNYLL